jgi:hypothetical protein
LSKSSIKPTEGEFDTIKDRAIFAKKYFWKLLLKNKNFDDLITILVPKFNVMPQQKVLLKKESKFSRGFTRKNADFY